MVPMLPMSRMPIKVGEFGRKAQILFPANSTNQPPPLPAQNLAPNPNPDPDATIRILSYIRIPKNPPIPSTARNESFFMTALPTCEGNENSIL